MPKKLCNINKHTWRKTRSNYELCTTCGTTFPCRNKTCEHFDCMYVRGQEIPLYWATLLGALGIAIDTDALDAIKKSMETDEP